MWLRLALNLSVIILISACSPSDRDTVDKLNSLSYACHYRDIDSTAYYARLALDVAVADDQRAEALNNLAFVAMARMDYRQADSLLNEAVQLTDNQIELLVAEVQQMRLCQRRSDNRAFYEHRERAQQYLLRISEEQALLSPRQQMRRIYAQSEMAIVNSTYYFYVGLERLSVQAILALDTEEARRDTAQYLNYLYNIGAGGSLLEGTREEARQEEMDCLRRCLKIARRQHYPYFEAQALEAMADHTGDLALAEEALRLFQQYGDAYQIAGAHRTLASCYHARGEGQKALEHLHMALADSTILQAPDLVASIREQLSVAYAAVNDKQQSDQNRQQYLELQEQTRQDRELEARAGILDKEVSQLNWMIIAVLGGIVLLACLLALFNRMNKKSREGSELGELLEQKQEEVAEARLRVSNNERRHLEQRAKVSLAMGIMPLIDRIRHATKKLSELPDGPEKSETLDYIRELTDNINEQNDLLTRWVQLRQGQLSLHIESFPLQTLLDMLARSKAAFDMKGLQLHLQPTSAVVKADRVLTLFMLNTLADNARKFTPQGGEVSVSATETADYVEIAISDTGCGMSEEQLAHVFDHQVRHGHGFGLMNCRGIIEKYKKISSIFSVCLIQAESQEGRGSRFFFRLPVGRLLTVVYCLLTMMFPASAADARLLSDRLEEAHVYADSAYQCNMRGDYQRALLFADSCLKHINACYHARYPDSHLNITREGDESVTPTEIVWFHQGVDMDYQLLLDIRNESAVAALALHKWMLYAYNNKVYTQLFKEMSADNTLADYCRTMQHSQQNKRIAVILLLVLFASLAPAYYLVYYRHRLQKRFHREHQLLTQIEMAEDELKRAELEDANLYVANAVLDNCLSTLKHETMYYPSRIRQLVDKGEQASLGEVAAYYRDLYGILIEQAMGQVERIHLHVRPVTLYGQSVLGDENLLNYLFSLLKSKDVTSEVKDDKYVSFSVVMPVPAVDPVVWQLCRQIVRDHGEATSRRACGITLNKDTSIHKCIIILPRYNGQV